MLKDLIIVLACTTLLACANQSIEYGPKQGRTPEGYSEQKVSEAVYRIRYETYKNVTPEEVEQMALRRAAELTQAWGYSEFEVLGKRQGMVPETEWIESTGTLGTGDPSVAPAAAPGHTRAFHIRFVEMTVRFLGQASSAPAAPRPGSTAP